MNGAQKGFRETWESFSSGFQPLSSSELRLQRCTADRRGGEAEGFTGCTMSRAGEREAGNFLVFYSPSERFSPWSHITRVGSLNLSHVTRSGCKTWLGARNKTVKHKHNLCFHTETLICHHRTDGWGGCTAIKCVGVPLSKARYGLTAVCLHAVAQESNNWFMLMSSLRFRSVWKSVCWKSSPHASLSFLH